MIDQIQGRSELHAGERGKSPNCPQDALSDFRDLDRSAQVLFDTAARKLSAFHPYRFVIHKQALLLD